LSRWIDALGVRGLERVGELLGNLENLVDQ